MLPPVDSVIRGARRSEEAGFDSLWWADHLMGWSPDSMWTPDVAEIVRHQPSPHVFLDAVATMTTAGLHTSRVSLGTSVTDAIRRPPAVLAQQFLTLHHLTAGRTILGLGAGELENIEPYGLDYSRQVSRLEDALQVVRLLWESDEPVSFDGAYWPLKDAVLGLGAYEGTYPPIWLAAHGPRMLDLCGRFANGWLPIGLSVEAYRDSLVTIRQVAAEAGRDPDALEAGLFSYCVAAASHERAHQLLEAPLIRLYALLLPASVFERHGRPHPLGEEFYGLTGFVPTRLSREAALRAADAVPFEVVHEFIAHGTPDDLAARFREYEDVGMQHVVPWNLSFFADLSELRPSFSLLEEFLQVVRAGG